MFVPEHSTPSRDGRTRPIVARAVLACEISWAVPRHAASCQGLAQHGPQARHGLCSAVLYLPWSGLGRADPQALSHGPP